MMCTITIATIVCISSVIIIVITVIIITITIATIITHYTSMCQNGAVWRTAIWLYITWRVGMCWHPVCHPLLHLYRLGVRLHVAAQWAAV